MKDLHWNKEAVHFHEKVIVTQLLTKSDSPSHSKYVLLEQVLCSIEPPPNTERERPREMEWYGKKENKEKERG
jgi:hypothetical protein